MADFASIKAKVKAKLQTLSVNAETVFSTDGVLGYEPEIAETTPDPFVTVTASDNESEYGNTAENKRIYGFVIRVFIERKNRTPDQAETDLTEIVDAIIDAFDQDITLGGEVLLSEAAPSVWEYSLGVKEYRVAEIRIRTMVWFDTTA